MYRAVEGTIKSVTVKHMPSGRWSAYLLVDNGTGDEVTVIGDAIGLDVGLEYFAVDSDGHEVENPRYLKQELKKLCIWIFGLYIRQRAVCKPSG